MALIKAVRSQAKIKLAISGPSGSGKTKSALYIAQGLGAKCVKVIDSENGSSSLYEGDPIDFFIEKLAAPYTVEKYVKAIDTAIADGCDCIIVDSASHAWAGAGGILEQKTIVDDRGGNSFTNWKNFSPKQQMFLNALVNSDIDMIVTVRSKQDYVMETTDKGKSAPKKVGLAPIQRDGFEYEFTTVFDMGMDHNAMVSKDRTGLFDGQVFKPTKETGKQIRAWLNGAKPAPKEELTVAKLINEIKTEVALTKDELAQHIVFLIGYIEDAATIASIKSVTNAAYETDDLGELNNIIVRICESTGRPDPRHT
jgi:hypothetical protein